MLVDDESGDGGCLEHIVVHKPSMCNLNDDSYNLRKLLWQGYHVYWILFSSW